MRAPEQGVDYSFKIVILGSGGAGKTCLFNRFCFNSYNFNTEMTIGINFHSTYLQIQSKDLTKTKYVVNSIFDFGGQERFKPLIPKFLEGADGALLVFDSVSFSSFQQLDYWYKKLDEELPIILVGSKSDLLDKTPKSEIVNESLINDYVYTKENIKEFCRTSALENYNVLEVFKRLTDLMLKSKKIEAILV